MSKRFIPFGMLPAAWGLKGQTRAVAQAEYELEGYELEKRLAEIDLEGDLLTVKNAEIDLKHEKISQKDHDYIIAELRNDPETTLKVKLKHKDISQIEYDKEFATLKDEPWVHFPDIELDPANPSMGSFQLDWNKPFIEWLEEHGYVAPKEEHIVDLWLTDLCKNVAMEELSGTGYFDEDVEEAVELKRKRIDDEGRVEVS